MHLDDQERRWASGEEGPALAMATRILAEMGDILGADRLIPVSSAHIDGCLYHGDSGVHFAELIVQGGGQVRIPTTLNVAALDLHRPQNVHLPAHEQEMARRLMQAYVQMGCRQTWTCAPYQVGHRPAAGEDVAWAESNAVVFVNSVLGARTNRYGDFLDICSAITGRAPRYGLHIAANRKATVVVDTSPISSKLKRNSAFYPVLGSWLGRTVGSAIAVFTGLPSDLPEDSMKAMGAAAASTGAVALFHIEGVTPEARTLSDVLAEDSLLRRIILAPEDIEETRRSLSTDSANEVLDIVSLGSPHYSLAEIDAFEHARKERALAKPVIICTSRFMLALLQERGQHDPMRAAGVQFVTDTCVVVTPILPSVKGVLMTDSGKFAHYTTPNTGYSVVFGSVNECVESAVAGHVVRLPEEWH